MEELSAAPSWFRCPPCSTALRVGVLLAAVWLPMAAAAQTLGTFAPGPSGTSIAVSDSGAGPASKIDAAAEDSAKAARTQQTAEDEAWQKQQLELLNRGAVLLNERKPETAIRESFDPVIAAYEARYPRGDTVYFCARTPTETLLYLTGLAAEHDRTGTGKSGVVLAPTWAYAYFKRGYALVELNRWDEAAEALDKALALSPNNPEFMVERAYVYRASRDWEQMLAHNRRALENIDIGSPEDRRDFERAWALRGQGYALIELDQLDEAEKSFKQSLKLEPDSEVAKNELHYIKQQRKKK